MAETEGSLGSQETANTGLLLCVVSLATFLMAMARGIDLAFSIAPLIIPGDSVSPGASFSAQNVSDP